MQTFWIDEDDEHRSNGKLLYLGRYDTPAEAHAAYLQAKGR